MLDTLGVAYGTDETLAVFSDEGFVEAVLRLERALLQVQESLQIVPAGQAARLARLRAVDFDLAGATRAAMESGNPSIGLIRQLYEASEYAHYGITSQDVWDTAHVLQIQAALKCVMKDVRLAMEGLINLAECHVDTPMVARTQGQIGAPITFGFKVACWLDELLRISHKLISAAAESAVLTVSGSVGIGSAFQVMGVDPRYIEQRVAACLALRCSRTPLAVSRDRFVTLAGTLGEFCTLAGRIAHEVFIGQRSGIGELAEGGAAGSSAVPQKVNPWVAQRMHGLAAVARGLVPIVASGASLIEGEREVGSMHAEWYGLSHLCLLGARLAKDLAQLCANLEVCPDVMRENLEADPSVLSESLGVLLGRSVGKRRALELMKQAVLRYRAGTPFRDCVLDVFECAGVPAPPEHLFEAGTLGWSVTATHEVVQAAKAWLAQGPEVETGSDLPR